MKTVFSLKLVAGPGYSDSGYSWITLWKFNAGKVLN